ncbi:hypothetical protein [Microbacterium murale]|uniref:Uncharacterized protein n=1 Tax=Microbacterium murale TaxID=1081040 RepID=A0ABQ1RWG7_9MICO|nr:hypothetical protein [Microbacterium murale]GGD84723.1 hypothetical protein GCM10007269_29620 [Microbacterium murale]
MSTSDQQGNSPLTRKQLREIRLTGTTPVISEEEAAAAAAEAQPAPAVPVPRPAEPIAIPPTPLADAASEGTPLTRRQAREKERIRTASVPVVPAEEPEADAATDDAAADELVSGVPSFAKPADSAKAAAAEEQPREQPAASDAGDDDDEDLDGVAVGIAPVSAAVAVDSTGEVSLDADEPAAAAADESSIEEHDADPLSALGVDAAGEAAETDEEPEADELPVAEPVETGENHVVSPTFGNGLLADKSEVPSFAPSFDELITADSGGSQHLAPNTLIFNPSPGGGSLSGPVASTGEILVTGSYELPRGIGSQGHAHGAADGKETDAVLIDGELPPSSSPTPIAASSAISTIKPAGEVIRPPAPEKGNKLMLTLAITAGGLALALAVALIVAFTTNIF